MLKKVTHRKCFERLQRQVKGQNFGLARVEDKMQPRKSNKYLVETGPRDWRRAVSELWLLRMGGRFFVLTLMADVSSR